MDSLSPVNSFRDFDKQRFLKLAQFYPRDFSKVGLVTLDHQLGKYIVDVRSKKEFCELKGISYLSSKLLEKERMLYIHWCFCY